MLRNLLVGCISTTHSSRRSTKCLRKCPLCNNQQHQSNNLTRTPPVHSYGSAITQELVQKRIFYKECVQFSQPESEMQEKREWVAGMQKHVLTPAMLPVVPADNPQSEVTLRSILIRLIQLETSPNIVKEYLHESRSDLKSHIMEQKHMTVDKKSQASAWTLWNDKCKLWPYIICPLQLNINLTVVTDNLKVGAK